MLAIVRIAGLIWVALLVAGRWSQRALNSLHRPHRIGSRNSTIGERRILIPIARLLLPVALFGRELARTARSSNMRRSSNRSPTGDLPRLSHRTHRRCNRIRMGFRRDLPSLLIDKHGSLIRDAHRVCDRPRHDRSRWRCDIGTIQRTNVLKLSRIHPHGNIANRASRCKIISMHRSHISPVNIRDIHDIHI